MKAKFVVWAEYNPTGRRWIGHAVEMRSGTHEHYNVTYNGICQGENFATKRQAMRAARKSR